VETTATGPHKIELMNIRSGNNSRVLIQ
jgi:hypothetical protein